MYRKIFSTNLITFMILKSKCDFFNSKIVFPLSSIVQCLSWLCDCCCFVLFAPIRLAMLTDDTSVEVVLLNCLRSHLITTFINFQPENLFNDFFIALASNFFHTCSAIVTSQRHVLITHCLYMTLFVYYLFEWCWHGAFYVLTHSFICSLCCICIQLNVCPIQILCSCVPKSRPISSHFIAICLCCFWLSIPRTYISEIANKMK